MEQDNMSLPPEQQICVQPPAPVPVPLMPPPSGGSPTIGPSAGPSSPATQAAQGGLFTGLFDGPPAPGASDARSVAESICGLDPGPLGKVCTLGGMLDTAHGASPTTDGAFTNGTNLLEGGLDLASLLATPESPAIVQAAGPIGLGVGGAVAAGKLGAWGLNEMNNGQQKADADRSRDLNGQLPPPAAFSGPTGNPLADAQF